MNNKRKRNRRIDIERPSGELDGANQPTGTYVRVVSRWGYVLGKTGMATIRGAEGGIPAAPGMYSWEVQFDPEVYDTSMRVNYKGRYFDIKEIRHDFAGREYTHLVCELGANNG
jgi:head-tail adaptor